MENFNKILSLQKSNKFKTQVIFKENVLNL